MSKTCKTETTLINNPFIPKCRPGQILPCGYHDTHYGEQMSLVFVVIPVTHLLPKPKMNLAGSGAALKSGFPSRMKRSGRKTSGSS